MELIILTDGLYYLVPVTKEMIKGLSLVKQVGLTCSDMCEILRLKLSIYSESINAYVMQDGSGNFFGCICDQ